MRGIHVVCNKMKWPTFYVPPRTFTIDSFLQNTRKATGGANLGHSTTTVATIRSLIPASTAIKL